uniref:Immunoglobulin domain-containing protein n=1 Tax=Moschus moschiferus TaxID=68415 RepID=A0A8C6FP01_MOSMO
VWEWNLLLSSSAVSGPRAVSGVEQGSLTVRCRYDNGWERCLKWWCRGAAWSSCRFVVKTTGSEKEVKKGRVSIKDNWKDRSFTVTMEKLRLDDSDTYWCGIERVGTDLGDQVQVTIFPGKSLCVFVFRACSFGCRDKVTQARQLTSCPRVPHRPLLGSIHFLLLVFLKVPLLLGMLGAVLWVNRPLRNENDLTASACHHKSPPR